MLADTAKLAIDLSLTGNARTGLAGVSKQLAGIDRQTGQIGRGFKTLGAGIGVAFRNAAFIGIAALGGLTALIAKSVKEGQEAAKVQTIYANAISNSGKVSTQYVAILNKQQTELMNLAGIDDELIKSSQTRLIQMGLTGEQTAKITPLILDFAKATGIDLLTATKLVGKSINGNTGALARYGVNIDKTLAKTDPFTATQNALGKAFLGTTQALSGSLEARLGAFRENLANIREEAGIKLLPALTRIVDVAGKDLVPAFGKFIDRIMPSLISGVDKFASLLENGGAERGIKAITDALGPMVELLKLAAAPVKAIVSAFLSLPSQVQGVLIGAFAVNKLSGGLIAKGVGEIAGGVLQRGGTPANPLFVMDVSGGGILGKVGAVGAGAAATGAGTLALTAAGALIAAPIVLAIAAQSQGGPRRAGGSRGFFPGSQGNVIPGTNDLRDPNGLAAPVGGGNLTGIIAAAVRKLFKAVADSPGAMAAGAALARRGVTERAAAAGFHPSEAAIQRTLDKNAKHAEVIQARIAASTKATADRMLALPGAISAALRGIILSNPTTVNDATGFTVPLRKPKVVNSSTGFTVPALAGGAFDIPADMSAVIHKGEMVLPRTLAEFVRNRYRYSGLHNTSHPLPGLPKGYVPPWKSDDVPWIDPPAFVPSARLDASQIIDRRRIGGRPTEDRGAYIIKAVASTRDISSAGTVKGRYGPTYTGAGAG